MVASSRLSNRIIIHNMLLQQLYVALGFLLCIECRNPVVTMSSLGSTSTPLDLRSLNLGACTRNGGDLFCQRFVMHSFCDVQQDECFCIRGYLSVNDVDPFLSCKPCESFFAPFAVASAET